MMEFAWSDPSAYLALAVEIARLEVLEMRVGRLVLAAALLLAALLFRRRLGDFLLGRLGALARRSRFALDDELVASLTGPAGLVPVIVGLALALALVNVPEDAEIIAARLLQSLVAFDLFWALFRAMGPFSHVVMPVGQRISDVFAEWLVKLLRALVVVLGAATVLELWGIEVGALLAGLGLVGVAVALGAQDLFKNLIAGILMIAERRFEHGDWIRVEGVVEGVVESSGFRSTLIRRFDKAPVQVPNAKLAEDVVINFSRMSHRRIYWTIQVVYGTTADQLARIRARIEQTIRESADFAQPPEVPLFVVIDQFSASAIDIMLYAFTRTTAWGEYLEIKQALAYEVKRIVEEEGSSFAFPSHSLYIEHWPETPAPPPARTPEPPAG